MAVLLGAKSIDEAITGLENLHRMAGQDNLFVKETESARRALVGMTQRLAKREALARQTEPVSARIDRGGRGRLWQDSFG